MLKSCSHIVQGGLQSPKGRNRIETETELSRSRPKHRTLTFNDMPGPACGNIEAMSKLKDRKTRKLM